MVFFRERLFDDVIICKIHGGASQAEAQKTMIHMSRYVKQSTSSGPTLRTAAEVDDADNDKP